MSVKPAIGIIGAGRLGTAVTRQALKAGYQVRIANSKTPESLKLILSVLLPGAQAATVPEVISASDIILLALPLHKYTELSPELFKGKIVIDAMNYWPPTQGRMEAFETSSSSEVIQRYLKSAKVVKTLSHVAYHELEEHALPAGTPNRRAILMASDHAGAKLKIARLINDLGFDPVDMGALAEGHTFQPDTNLFNARYTSNEIAARFDLPYAD